MAFLIRAENISVAWDELLRTIIESGNEINPRGKNTKELLNVSIEVTQALRNILIHPIRNLNYRFMIAEWLWIQAGLNEVDILAKYNSVMRNFSDNGEILSGAYGPRLLPQLPYVLESLSNPGSRQAVATIWTPSPPNSKDIPCTISIQWMVRFGFVHATVNMRSSDAWLGLPYDFFTFSQITNFIAMKLGRPVGSMTMNLGSSHLYEEHWTQGEQCGFGRKSVYETSPHLPRNEPIPTSAMIEKWLRDPPRTTYSPKSIWGKYAYALSTSKPYTLEVLGDVYDSTL